MLAPGKEPLTVLVRAAGVPVGRLELREGVSELANAIPTAVAETALRAGLAALLGNGLPARTLTVADALAAARAGPVTPPDAPTITVAICTKDRVQQLERALTSVAPSLGAADELLVVDNASRDDAVERLLRQRFPSAKYVREERPGLGWARNRAIVEARSDVIAFCDDDCVMEPDTLAALRTVLARNPDVDAVTGLVEPLGLGGRVGPVVRPVLRVRASLSKAMDPRTALGERGAPRGQHRRVRHRRQPVHPSKCVRSRWCV